jgi:very-short-patch-repair endonuclease
VTTRFDHTYAQTARARALRRNATRPEQRLWLHLRSAQIGGFSFRRQHPVGPYVLDFYCPALKLAIELDGDQHGSDGGLARDAARSRFLQTKGIRVIRFPNHLLKEDLPYVLEAIAREVVNSSP